SSFCLRFLNLMSYSFCKKTFHPCPSQKSFLYYCPLIPLINVTNMKLLTRVLFLLLFIPFVASAQAGLDTLSLKTIFYEPLLAGNRPDFVSFSPNLTHVYYQANDSAMAEEEYFRATLNG